MPEAVIVATARSPIGRANKGSLVDVRPDDLAAQIVTALLAKVPDLDPATVEDLIVGCGQPAGEAGFNVARVTAILAGIDVPGVPEFLEMITDSGGHLWACRMSADMMHLTEEDLYERVEGIISASDFIELSEGAQTIFI